MLRQVLSSAFAFALAAAAAFAADPAAEEPLVSVREPVVLQADGRRVFTLPLEPEWRALLLKARISAEGLVPGGKPWSRGQFSIAFKDADGRSMGSDRNPAYAEGTDPGRDVLREVLVPDGAASAVVTAIHMGWAGTFTLESMSLSLRRCRAEEPCNAALPAGAPRGDPWSLDGAAHASTARRHRWCLNGLWGFRPPLEGDPTNGVPSGNWGWAKIPSTWEVGGPWGNAITNAGTRTQDVWFSPWVEDHPERISGDIEAWYRRSFVMPPETAGKRVVLTFTMLNTHATVYVDGRRAAEIGFPGGEADITAFVKPGKKQRIDLDVTAYPLSKETANFNAPDRSESRKASVKNKGVTGDLFLDAYPKGPRIASGTVECDVAGRRATFVADLADAPTNAAFRLVAAVRPARGDGRTGVGQTFESPALRPDSSGRLAFSADWADAAVWDPATPENLYTCSLELYDSAGAPLDAAIPFRFGFRDVRIAGRDLLLNGVPIHLRGCNAGTIGSRAAGACAETARELIARLREDGFNFAIMDNYNFRAGSVSYLDALLDECDRAGFLVSFSLPHVGDFGEETHSTVKMEDPTNQANYRALADWAIKRARNHPCVIAWAMNHNMGGYAGDMDPLRIDGRYTIECDKREGPAWWSFRGRANCHVGYEIARSIDSTRPIYHHESGNLDDFHTTNIYLNWAPVQERSDWLQHWSETGEKPLFFVEWGMPHIASWSSHRGPEFIHSTPLLQSMWISEFAAAFRGDAAYEGDSPGTVAALAREEELWAKGEPFPFWKIHPVLDHHGHFGGNYAGVVQRYMADNWRSHRAWGITAMVPWDQGKFHAGTGGSRENPAKWRGLKRPGIVPDRFPSEGCLTGLGDRRRFSHTAIGDTVARWNGDDLAFIGGDGVFTDKAHHFRPGDKIRKTLVILNDRRTEQTVKWECTLRQAGQAVKTLSGSVKVAPGTRRDVPVSFRLPKDGFPYCTLDATFAFEGGAVHSDEFDFEIYAPAPRARVDGLRLYDPKGLTTKELKRLGIRFEKVDDLAAVLPRSPSGVADPLVIGRECLTSNILYDVLVPRAKAGGRILVFEQTKETLESVGFRAQTYGLRNVFPRSREAHDALGDRGLDALRDWNGESTIAPPYLPNIAEVETQRPTDAWAGFENYRVWRCRNRGCVATAIPEKPTLGDWMPLVDGGFDLQYAPLLEWRLPLASRNWSPNECRQPAGTIVFCQLDVTARTAADPVAENIVNNLVAYMGEPREPPVRILTIEPPRTPTNRVFRSGDAQPADLRAGVAAGDNVLCLGFTADEVAAWSPIPLAMAHTNHCYAARIKQLPFGFDGLCNADWQWHGSMEFDAFLGRRDDGNAAIRVVQHGKGLFVFWQVPPESIDEAARPYLRTSKRRAQFMLSRLAGNLGIDLGAPDRIGYADVPEANDDPYRYYRW